MSQFKLLYGEEILPIIGDFPLPGQILPSFMLVDDQFNDIPLAQFDGQYKILITLLSLDEQEHGGMRLLRETLDVLERWPWLQAIIVSVDSPSTLRRTRKERGLPNIVLLSTLRGRDFHKHFGVLITEYPLAGYTAPALILTGPDNSVLYAERLRDTIDDFNLPALQTRLQSIDAELVAAQRRAEELAARQHAEAEERERQEHAAADANKHSSGPG